MGAALTFRFTGTSLKYYSTKNRNIGIAAFSIDGGAEEEVDLYQSSKQDQALVYEAKSLQPGTHTLKVRVTGKKNSAATDCVIVADKIEVWNQAETDDHSQTAVWNRKEASATAPGYTGDTYCTVCGKQIAKGEAIPAIGEPGHTKHIWDKGGVTKQPTASEKGEKTFTCTVRSCRQGIPEPQKAGQSNHWRFCKNHWQERLHRLYGSAVCENRQKCDLYWQQRLFRLQETEGRCHGQGSKEHRQQRLPRLYRLKNC